MRRNARSLRVSSIALGAVLLVALAPAWAETPKAPKAKPTPTWSSAPAPPVPPAIPAPADPERAVIVIEREGAKPLVRFIGQDAVRGYLGVTLSSLTPELRRHFGAPEDAGVLVSSVAPGSPAEKAGVQVGDVLTRIDGDALADQEAVQQVVFGKKAGDVAAIEVVRARKPVVLRATIAETRRPRVDVGDFVFELDGDASVPGALREFDFGALPQGLERIEILPIQIDEMRLRALIERVRAEAERTAGREDAAVEKALEARRLALEKRLKELEKQMQELEARVNERSDTKH